MTSIKSQINCFTESKITKKCIPGIWNWKKQIPSYFELDKLYCSCFERKKWIPAIWRQKNVVNNCQEQGKRL